MDAIARIHRNREGIRNGYGWCKHCHDTWDWKDSHTIAWPGGYAGMFPYCEECHAVISIERKKELITQLVNEWIGCYPEDIEIYLAREAEAFGIVDKGG
jgi:hypothetical protein